MTREPVVTCQHLVIQDRRCVACGDVGLGPDPITALERRVTELETGLCGMKKPDAAFLGELHWWYCSRCEIYHIWKPQNYVVESTPNGDIVRPLGA